jgi:hypothetical protein
MISVVQICNLALSHIGQRPIVAITDNSNEARKCLLNYEFARDSVLRAHDWNFATTIESLATIADETIPGWDFLYMRPAHCLYIRKIYNDSTVKDARSTEFKEVKTSTNLKAIACNIAEAYAEFTHITTDPNDFDSNFVEALTFKLASLLTKAITGDIALGDKMEGRYLSVISDARRVNSSERNVRTEPFNSYIDAR